MIDLPDRIARARRARPTCVDPYVQGLAALADLVDAYFAARYRFKSCDSVEVGIASAAYRAARAQLVAAVGLPTERIEQALREVGADQRPDPNWQEGVWGRINRPSWWRRAWNRITGRKS